MYVYIHTHWMCMYIHIYTRKYVYIYKVIYIYIYALHIICINAHSGYLSLVLLLATLPLRIVHPDNPLGGLSFHPGFGNKPAS